MRSAQEIEALGVECLKFDVNIRDTASVDAFRDATLDRFGAADYLINNAGGQFQAHPFNISDNGWRAVIDLNLNGTWNVCSRFMRHMMERHTGSIVNVAHVFSFERGAPDVCPLRRGTGGRGRPDAEPRALPRTAQRHNQCSCPRHDHLPGGGRQLRHVGEGTA